MKLVLQDWESGAYAEARCWGLEAPEQENGIGFV
jgi:hypothetical protein